MSIKCKRNLSIDFKHYFGDLRIDFVNKRVALRLNIA